MSPVVRCALGLGAASLALVACADEDRAAVPAAEGQDEEAACEAAEEIARLDDLVEEGLDEAEMTPEGFEQFLDEFNETADRELPTLVAAYEQLADNVPADLRGDVETLAAFTERAIGEMAEAESAEELSTLFDPEDPELREAVDATFAVDEWSRETCDVVIADD